MDILSEIVEALERNAVPAEIRIASILDRIRCLRSPSTGSRSLSLLAVEAYERGYQEAQVKLAEAKEDVFNKGFKEGKAVRRAEGKSAFEAGVEKGKRDAEKKHADQVNHLRGVLTQAGKNYTDVAAERDIAYARGYQEAKRAIRELQQKELDEHFKNGYEKGYEDCVNKFGTHEQSYQSGYHKGSDEGALQSATDIIRLRNEYSNTLEKAKEEYAAEILGLTYKHEQALEVKWREGYNEGKAIKARDEYERGRASGVNAANAFIENVRAEAYQNGFKDGYYNGLQAAAKAVDTKILAATSKEPTLSGMTTPAPKPIPPWQQNQVMADTSNWDMRARTVKP